jgi:LPS export ABC transporter protein LptC
MQQIAIKVLRVVLPIIFVGFIAVIVASWSRDKPRHDQPISQPVLSTARPQDKPRLESHTFEDTQTIAGRVASRIRAERVVSFASGWNTLENVQLTIYRANGLTYDITSPTAQFNGQTKEAEAKGGVHVVSSDGVEIHTAEIHFNGTHLTNDVEVDFTVDRWKGKGGALDLDVQAEMLHLKRYVDATMVPSHPGELPMTIRGDDGIFRRRENDVTFDRNVVMTRLRDRITNDHMVGRFSADRKSLIALEGNGHVNMLISANSPVVTPGNEDLGGEKHITCDRFFSELGADGQINAINCVGEQAPAHAVIDGPPRRDLVARTFRIALLNRAVNDIRANDQVSMHESGELPRELTTDHMTIFFEPVAHRASTALLEGNLKYKDPKNSATAVKATYDITGDRVLLSAEFGFDPTVTSDGQIIKAKQIEFSPKAGTAKATGDVIAQIVSKGNAGASADSTTVFPANKPVFINCDTVTMRQLNRVALFSGNVRAWQETNTLLSQELQVTGAGELIAAKGNVRTILYNTNDPSKKTPLHTSSDQLLARKTDRRIDLAGNVRMDDDDRTITSDRSSFYFDANRKMERMEAESKVVLVERSTNRRGTGDKANYLIARKMIYMSGSPAVVTAPSGSLSGGNIAVDVARNKMEVVNNTGPTEGTYKSPPKP